MPTAAVVAYGTALGVFVDLDHFLIARLKTGSWDPLRFCLQNPIAAVAEQDRIFGSGDVGVLSRLLSHHLIGGVLVVATASLSVPLAIVTGVVLYVHVLCDLAWDSWRLEHHVETSASEDELVRALR